jgi:hypothetical protein
VPKRRFHGCNWISVQETQHLSSNRTDKSIEHQTFLLSESQDLEDQVGIFLHPANTLYISKSNQKEKIKSSAPKSSNYVNHSINKYHCPYYIKPNQWEKINSAPRFDEKLEKEKLHNFYEYMHYGNVNPDPFNPKDKNDVKEYLGKKKILMELPSIQKYKMYTIYRYLKEKKLRIPACLIDY